MSNKSKIPSGVTEVQYRKALAAIKKQEASSSSIDAAALQADMSRRFNLSQGPKLQNRQQLVVRNNNSNSLRNRRSPSVVIEVLCDCCQARCTSADEVCQSCGYFLVGAPEPPPETLAQRRGLVAPPPTSKEPALSELQWNAIEASIVKRSSIDSVCPICMEGFKHCDEVLLSCSHIFHRACLSSFEKFMKGQLTCPICRTTNYQKKVTQLGSKAYHGVCALKIQRCYRGYLGRKRSRRLFKSYYKEGKGNEMLRKKYYENEFSHLTGKIDKHFQKRSGQVDVMISSMDKTLSDGKQIDFLFEQMLIERTIKQQQSHSSGHSSSGNNNSIRGSGFESKWSEEHKLQLLGGDSDVNWTEVFELARQRGNVDCAICMSAVVYNTCNAMASGKRNTILSCSHVFHENCLLNFERFLVNTVPTCPVCRCGYEKKTYIPG